MARSLNARAIPERERLMDADLGGDDSLPGNADFLLDEHWGRQERNGLVA